MNRHKILPLILLIWVTLGACEKLLEEDKDNQYTKDRVLNQPSFAEGILLSAYRSIPNSYIINEVATDDAVTNEKSDNFLRIATGEWSSINNPLNTWTTSYDAIFNINYFLSVVDQIEWSWKSDIRSKMFNNRFKGEALALRAYFNYQLLISHGGVAEDGQLLGVPLVTEVLDVKDNWALPRDTFQDCLDQINKDLDSAIVKLPITWADKTNDPNYNLVFGKQNLNRVNGTIAKAIKSKVALLAASPAFNNSTFDITKYTEAAKLAGKVIVANGGITSLNAQGHLFFDDDNDPFTTEILWRNDYLVNNTLEALNYPPSLFGSGNVNPTQNLVDAFPMLNGYPISELASGYNPLNPYLNRDPRLKAYIIYDGNKMNTTTIRTNVTDLKDGLNNSTDATRTGYYLLKLLRNNVNLNPSAINTRRHFKTHIRFTEIFLNYAEAANEAWGPNGDPEAYGFSARSVIAAIRKRAGLSAADPYLASITTKEAMRDLIRNERRLELCFEGFRFWDLRRWELNLTQVAKGVSINNGVFTVIDVENRVYQPFMKFGPIPYNETLKYTGLLQNQGW